MDKDTHVFEVKETLKERWWISFLCIFVIWLGFSTLFYRGSIMGQWIFIFPCVLSVLFFIQLLLLRNVSYKVSATKVVKKRSKKILHTIELCSVKGIVAKLPVQLKVSGERDFVFEGIGIKSSRERLISILQELGIKEIKVERKKLGSKRTIILIGAILCASHFLGSILWWIMGSIVLVKYKGVGVDWPMLLHAIPVVILLFTSILSVVLVLKRRRRAGLILILTVIISISCFIFDTTKGFYQESRDDYFTWWWYGKLFKETKPFKSSYKTTSYKIGYIDKTGEIIIEPQFEIAKPFSEGMAVIGIRIKNEKFDSNSVADERDHSGLFPHVVPYFHKYGYIDDTGKIIVEPKYNRAKKFSEGLALVVLNGKYGYINKFGEISIDLKFDNKQRLFSGNNFSEGLAVVVVEKKYGYIDKIGNYAISPQFSRASPFSEGLAVVKIDNKYGYIDKTGQVAIQPKFDYARQFLKGLAVVKINDKWGYIDNVGKVIIEPTFDFADYFSQELARVEIDTMWGYVQKRGYIDKRGNIVIEPKYYMATDFSDGLANVCSVQGWGYRAKYKWEHIDKTGTTVNKPYFDNRLFFSEGLAEVRIDNKYGYVDKNGTIVIEAKYDTAGRFSQGLAMVGFKIVKKEKEIVQSVDESFN
ncbi:MAG: WG repeat-containing protein [Planctomycetota bacterium]|jgi:hypothetical protein